MTLEVKIVHSSPPPPQQQRGPPLSKSVTFSTCLKSCSQGISLSGSLACLHEGCSWRLHLPEGGECVSLTGMPRLCPGGQVKVLKMTWYKAWVAWQSWGLLGNSGGRQILSVGSYWSAGSWVWSKGISPSEVEAALLMPAAGSVQEAAHQTIRDEPCAVKGGRVAAPKLILTNLCPLHPKLRSNIN